MRAIFLADAHLSSPEDSNYRHLLAFLRDLKNNADTLFIMGDLMDFWIGFPSQPSRQYDPLIESLRELKQSGCNIVYFEGNHDFHLGPVFSDYLEAEIHTRPAIQTIQGKKLFLCHGDQINRADLRYRFLRLILRNRIAKALVNYFPPSIALYIRKRLQKSSRVDYQARAVRWNYRQIISDFAAHAQTLGCDGLVTGHFHLAFIEKMKDTSFTTLSLGDWMGQYTYGEMLSGKIYIRTYHPN